MDPAVAAVTFIVMEDRHAKYKLDLLLSFHHNHSTIEKDFKRACAFLKS
jgi:ubiquitin